AVKLMSEGELLQIEKSRNLNLSEAIYYDIINGKTASLLASACAAGATTTTDNLELVERMLLFG
ncbi:polyprenyl synthetase family protein, partial [Escherichia coli]